MNNAPLPCGRVAELLCEREAFVDALDAVLRAAPFTAFRFETPAWHGPADARPFEFVLLDAPLLARPPERADFAAHFAAAREGVACFDNLGGDARLIVPAPLRDTADDVYVHLAAFSRGAPREQRQALWRAVGRELRARHAGKPLWLNTAGAGVAWLHVRIDARPKYYGHAPYARP